jgi:hypothetical protein
MSSNEKSKGNVNESKGSINQILSSQQNQQMKE